MVKPRLYNLVSVMLSSYIGLMLDPHFSVSVILECGSFLSCVKTILYELNEGISELQVANEAEGDIKGALTRGGHICDMQVLHYNMNKYKYFNLHCFVVTNLHCIPPLQLLVMPRKRGMKPPCPRRSLWSLRG